MIRKTSGGLKAAANEARKMSVGTLEGARSIGDLQKRTFDGQEGASGRFVGVIAVNGATTSTKTTLTESSVFTAVNAGFLAKVWNSSGTGIYATARLIEVAITLAPAVDLLAQRSLTGAYAITAPKAGAASANGMADILQHQDSMFYVAPLREVTTYSISAVPFCSRASRTVTYRMGGTDTPWIGAGTAPPTFISMAIADIHYFGLATATETNYVYISALYEFKGFNIA